MTLSALAKGGRAALCAVAIALGIVPAVSAQSNLPPGELGGLSYNNTEPGRLLVAQADSAQLMVRIQQLEEQIRQLNGQVEGLTFQLTQMQELVTRLEQNTNNRLQALEGGGSGNAEAAPAAGGATQPQAAPQDPANVPDTDIPPQGVVPLPGEVEFDPTFDDGSVPTDQLGQSSDPLVGTGAGGAIDLATGQPLNLSYDPSATETPSGNADADAQFQAGYDALMQGDYAFAEDQLTQFLELYPNNPKATDAANWLGDALIYRAAYTEAAAVLLDAYQKAPDNPRAPDLLLKLGVSLSGAGERDVACRTFAQVNDRYTNVTPAFVARLDAERAKAQCPPA